jgi:hypothetical protein
MSILPREGGTIPATRFRNVDFPPPEGPSSMTRSPGSTSNRSISIEKPPPQEKAASRTLMAGLLSLNLEDRILTADFARALSSGREHDHIQFLGVREGVEITEGDLVERAGIRACEMVMGGHFGMGFLALIVGMVVMVIVFFLGMIMIVMFFVGVFFIAVVFVVTMVVAVIMIFASNSAETDLDLSGDTSGGLGQREQSREIAELCCRLGNRLTLAAGRWRVFEPDHVKGRNFKFNFRVVILDRHAEHAMAVLVGIGGAFFFGESWRDDKGGERDGETGSDHVGPLCECIGITWPPISSKLCQ